MPVIPPNYPPYGYRFQVSSAHRLRFPLDDPDRELVPRGVVGIANQEKTWRCPCVLAFPGEAFQAEPPVRVI
jgi:hypothetical protein